ncbi:MAG TPA: ATP-binding cassette domain-containing protein [Roseiflexaceae bacterium]|nr:ATP-binding cassette domain-containing protein [Roseiflexaceae bacterium]
MPDTQNPIPDTYAMIKLERIHKYFHRGEGNEVHALRGVDLAIGAGEFVTVIGSNGAGKSTLLNCIAGVYPIDEGRMLLGERDATGLDAAQRAAWIGRVFQNPLDGTAANLSIEQNLALALLRGRTKGLRAGVNGQRREQFRAALSQLGLGLEDRMSSHVRTLSGGQRQALTLLMATLVPPQVLLLDEHTAALDPAAAALVADLTARLVAERNLTALMVTHNMQQALSYGTRTLMMHQGQIILDISGAERASLTVADLVQRFTTSRKDAIVDDELLLSE